MEHETGNIYLNAGFSPSILLSCVIVIVIVIVHRASCIPSEIREERGERREERDNSEKERQRRQDSNPQPHPRYKSDALDRLATVGRRNCTPKI